MALLTFLPDSSKTPKQPSTKSKKKKKHNQTQKKLNPPSSSSWDQFKNLLTCKQIQPITVHDPSKNPGNGSSKLTSTCSSICSFRDVVHGNTRVIHNNSPDGNSLSHDAKLHPSLSAARSHGLQFRKLSGCYECHTIVDPSRFPSARTTICPCSHCGAIFQNPESLELHQAIRHAVSELGQEDSGRNIVEIIFKSSWMKKDNPILTIERILKVHNTNQTIQKFEACRDAVKIRAHATGRKNPRCAADGNELLRFYCANLMCHLGARGSSSLCEGLSGSCAVCNIIRQGFGRGEEVCKGVRTTASSGRAHDLMGRREGRRAMLVCRVIAGRIRRLADETEAAAEEKDSGGYDSEADTVGIYSSLEELIVFNPKAILPCFVVIYKPSSS